MTTTTTTTTHTLHGDFPCENGLSPFVVAGIPVYCDCPMGEAAARREWGEDACTVARWGEEWALFLALFCERRGYSQGDPIAHLLAAMAWHGWELP